MILKNVNHDCEYHTRKIATMFFPLEKIVEDGEDGITVVTEKSENKISVCAFVYDKNLTKTKVINDGEDVAYAMSLLLFDVLSEITGFVPPWGILYGVRPARLMHAKYDSLGEEGAVNFFKKSLVSDNKINLALEVMKKENEIISLSRPDSYSLYVSIPFCPSRCSYCSFVSHSIENAKEIIPQYVDLLCKELEETAKVAKKLSLRLETVYFGGGTPTVLEKEELEKLLKTVRNNFDLSTLREYTVEAGRPDTVTDEKLSVLKEYSVDRISINPQTFSDEVLKNIGRRHTVEETLKAFEIARKAGFVNINMDIIAGLNGDSLDGFKNTLDTAVNLKADSITVHNLALKSGANLVVNKEYYEQSEKETVGKMVDYSYYKLKESGYVPYYMYRQSKSLGNLENVGWSKEGKECLYNIFMMDETHSVLAAGAGAVTKIKRPSDGHIDRIYNYKYPYEYINYFDEVIKRTKRVTNYYNS